MSKIVFFDIDGTICDEDMKIPESTISAIHKLQENGHLAFLCSGRAKANIRVKELGEIGFDGIIAACGNYVEMNGVILVDRLLDTKVVEAVITACRTYGMPMVLEGSKTHWVDAKGFEHDPYVDYMMLSMGEDAVYLPEETESCLKEEYLNQIYINKFSADIIEGTDFDAIRCRLEEYFDILEHLGGVVEFVPKGTSKATGIEWICRYLRIDREDTYAIGDSVNDLDMLQYVGHGIAMGNATQIVKDAAEYVTNGIHEDGIHNGLKHYRLI